MIFVAGISIGFFISALLLAKKQKSKSDIILLLWMILNSIHLTFFYLLHLEVIYDYPALLGLQFPLPLLHGVFLYYYVAAVTDRLPKKKYTLILHLIPTIVTFAYLSHYFILPSDQKVEIFRSGGEDYKVFQKVLLYAVFVSGIVYVIWSGLILKQHRKRIKNQFSDIEAIQLNWLRLLVYGLGAIWALIIVTQNESLIFMSLSTFVILVGFFGIQQRNIFSSHRPALKEISTNTKYTNSGLTADKEEASYSRLMHLVNEEKVYTDPELSLKELAAKLEIHPNYLSQIINDKEKKTFYDFVNTYRVEEFKRLIAIPKNQQFTLMAIAYDCGFNSKSTFNRNFKKITNQTPTQYLAGLNKR